MKTCRECALPFEKGKGLLCLKCRAEEARRRYSEDSEYRTRAQASAREYRKKNLDRCRERDRERNRTGERRARDKARSSLPHRREMHRRIGKRAHYAKYRKDPEFTERKIEAAKDRSRRRYGISPIQFQAMLEEQRGACAICGGGPTGRGTLHVDHNHQTGEIRGLLCSKCNTGIGQLNESPEVFLRALKYLGVLDESLFLSLYVTILGGTRKTAAQSQSQPGGTEGQVPGLRGH